MKGLKHGQPVCTVVHSHHNLTEIFYYLWHLKICPKNSFQDLVFRLVLFHQSLPGLEKYPPMVQLAKNERVRFCNLKFYSLMKLVMIADSGSYMLFNPEGYERNTKEFI